MESCDRSKTERKKKKKRRRGNGLGTTGEYKNKIEYSEKRLESVSAERETQRRIERERKKRQWWKVAKYIYSSVV